ncbi:MAG: carbon-nitrogen hydrolase [Verrucomicrobiota bacterium]|nr:carbon-nitrogen hydrolase [Limisphaera sp.]MDW8380792.1 carbon-nitrogen hydrolase [Verrucomicrobiota bacterium]
MGASRSHASRSVRIGLLQSAAVADPEQNLQRTLHAAEQAARQGAQILCTQELFRSLYFCQCECHDFFQLAEPIPGPSTRAFQQLARRRKVVIIASLFERRAPGLYHNTAVVIDADGALLGLYRKMHIPDDPLYYEKFYFTPGDLGFRTWQTRYARIGVLICWDQWYPEAARLTALQGAEVLFYPTAIGWHPKEKAEHGRAQHDAWEVIQRSHAIANGCYVAAVNRVGHERLPQAPGDGIEFWGQSFVASPFGELLAKAPSDREQILLADLDLEELDRARTHWPFLRDRRIDAYQGVTQRWMDPSV